MRYARIVPLVLLVPLAVPVLAGAGPSPAEEGRWSEPFQGQVAAVNMALLSTGGVLYYSGNEAGDRDWVYFLNATLDGQARVLMPPYTAASVVVPSVADGGESDLFCSANTILGDGRVLVAGGTHGHQLPDLATPLEGTDDARLFDGVGMSFVDAADMGLGRWYPSVVELPDGRALAASGIGALAHPEEHRLAMEVYDPAADAWTPLPSSADNVLPLYPRLFVVPGGPLKGQVFYSTVGTLWGTFGEHPAEGLWYLQQAFDPATNSWRILGPSLFGVRQHAAVVPLLLDPADGYAPKLVTMGGTLNRGVVATPLVEVADLSTDPPTNTVAAPMIHARWHLNGVLLPTGEVLAVGGGAYDNVVVHGQPNVPILPAEVYDPATGAWTELASMSVPRMYHSTAVLLPDGRVLVGGHVPLAVPWKAVRDHAPDGSQEQIVETRLEIFEPPYLFRGPRPVIAAVDDETLGYGQEFEVSTGSAASASAVLIRPGSTTHAFDADQRGVKLEVVARGAGTLTLKAPPDGAVAPPGWYMLFLLQDGVPSVAKFVHVG